MKNLIDKRESSTGKLDASDVLKYMIDILITYIKELIEIVQEDEFAYGERVAYTECLEMVCLWKDCAKHGLDFDVEQRFPL